MQHFVDYPSNIYDNHATIPVGECCQRPWMRNQTLSSVAAVELVVDCVADAGEGLKVWPALKSM